MSETDPDRRRSICPHCSHRGTPFSLTEGEKVRVIGYECDACKRLWTVDAAPGTPWIFDPRPEQ